MRITAIAAQLCLSGLLAGAGVYGVPKSPGGKYRTIELTRFAVAEGVQLPAEYQISLMEDLAQVLDDTDRFDEVLRPGEQGQEPGVPILTLSGTVVEYRAGSQSLLVGFGAGRTRIVAQVRFADKRSGEILLERKVEGRVSAGTAGGESIMATRVLAGKVAKIAKREFFSGVPDAESKTYEMALVSPAEWSTSLLSRGSYTLRLAGTNVVLRNELRRRVVRGKVRIERSKGKFSTTSVLLRDPAVAAANYRIVSVSLRGTDMILIPE